MLKLLKQVDLTTKAKMKRTHYHKMKQGKLFSAFVFIRDKETIQNIHYAISFELCTQVVLMQSLLTFPSPQFVH